MTGPTRGSFRPHRRSEAMLLLGHPPPPPVAELAGAQGPGGSSNRQSWLQSLKHQMYNSDACTQGNSDSERLTQLRRTLEDFLTGSIGVQPWVVGRVRYYKQKEGQRSRVSKIQEDSRHSDQP